MFGNLASPDDAKKDRSYRNIGNKVKSSPFRSSASPRAASNASKFPSSSFSSSSPNASILVAAASPQNFSRVLSNQKEKKLGRNQLQRSPTPPKNDMDWPDEDGIPAPGEYDVTPITLSSSKFSNNPSPSKVLINNKNTQGRLANFDSNKSKLEASDSPLKTLDLKEQRFKAQDTVMINSVKNFQNQIEPLNLSETKGEKFNTTMIDTTVESNSPSHDCSASNHNENKLPITRNHRNKSTRAMRLMKARRASPSPIISKNLKQSLQAAKAVMQEEKSDVGASDTSSRSSLTNKELSDIAKRALKRSKNKMQNELNEKKKLNDFKLNAASTQEARQALLNVTASKQKRTIESNAALERLGLKASRAVAMKNSTKTKPDESSQIGMDVLKTLSTYADDSGRSRRIEHPAFAGRPAKTNISSAHIMASFRQFNATRQSLSTKQKQVTIESNTKSKITTGKCFEDRLEQTFSDDDSLRSRASMVSLEQEETMHSVNGLPGDSMYSTNEIPGESMRSMSERRGESMHSMSDRQGRSMHSTSGRKHAEHFYRMGRVHITSKTNCNDTVMSSLSGNTQSLQSTMSQSVASKMKSPTTKNSQKTSFLLNPTPEYSSQTHESELVERLSPGPSSRSGHSFANSIISASPRADYRSPSLRERVNTSFMDTLEEKYSSSQESAGNSAELLDAALEAAIEDMEIIDSPRTNTSVCLEGNNIVDSDNDCLSKDISILPTSSSGRSHSSLDLVFKDTEESDVFVPPDPVGKGFVLANTIVGEEDNNSTSSNGISRKQGISEVNASADFDDANRNNDIVYQKQGSTSTKQTVSTSIRSGMSSIQNSPPVESTKSDSAFEGVDRETNEGSTSIRTGLSGIQSQKDSNDADNSISIHTNKNFLVQSNEMSTSAPSEDKEIAQNEESDSHNKPAINFSPQYPDTIHEENEVKSTQKSTVSLKDENNSLPGLKLKSTVTTDGSSGITTGASSLDHVSSDQSGNDSRTHPGSDVLNTNENILPPIQTEKDADEESSNNGFSLLSPGSRSSRPWKTNLGKSIGNAIKTVLAKASPRGNGPVSTRSNQSKCQQNEDCESLFSLDDDDDDIFGGLEVEKDENVFKSVTPRKQKIDEKTPRQKNFTSIEKKEDSASRRANGSLSRRTNESFSRRANGSLSRKTNESYSRKSNETDSNRKMVHMIGTAHCSASRKPPSTPSQQHTRTGSSPPVAPVVNGVFLYSNDRSGMIVDESEVVHNVNSDITSSLIGGPMSGMSGPSAFQKAMREASKLIEFGDQKKDKETTIPDEIPEEAGESFTLLMEESDTSSVEQKALESSNEGKSEPKEEEIIAVQAVEDEVEDEEEDKRVSSMFLNFGCGLVDPCSGFASLCTPANKVDDDADDEMVVGNDDGDKDYASVGSRSQLSTLEKKVWNEWDRFSPNNTNNNKSTNDDKKVDYDKKREAARDKLLDIANTALSSQISVKSGKSTLIEDDQCTKTTTSTTLSEGRTLSITGSTDSGFSKESESGASSNSFGNSLTSGDSLGSFSHDSTRGYSTSYSTAEESDGITEDRSHSSNIKSNTKTITPTAGPILLSFSQRSLMEKFSKQLTAVGVQVLKLNTRKQWQTRYFTVSTEQIALSAHEAISKTGEIAQCPKALLWLKKFNPKNGGYGIINIDKNGHGGMLLVDLVDIQVSDRKDDMLGNPIPKKLLDIFENSVLVTLKYKMKGILRSIEFRCRDNDEAQFLCTCMRVIRDLLRRERSLRQKLSKQVSNKKQTPSSSRGR